MEKNIVSLRTTVYPRLKKDAVLRGTILGSIGAASLLASETLLKASTLQGWGLPIFLVCIALMTYGLLPYQKLRNLENFPHKLVINEEGFIVYIQKSHAVFMLPVSDVKRVFYIEEEGKYGIAFILKNRCRSDQSFDIFLPYFSKRSCHELSEALSSIAHV